MEGNKIAALNVQLDFPSMRLHIDMRSYVKDLLLSLNWPMPKKAQLSPFIATPIANGQKTQFTPDKDTAAPLLPKRLKRIQKIIGPYLIMQELSITSCWLHLMPSAHNKLRQWYTLNNLSKHCWTTLPHTPIMALSTEQVTWCSAHMQMQDTSMRVDPAAGQVHIFTS